MGGEGGVSGDDVTWMMTSSGPRKSEYFGYKYMKVYGDQCVKGWRRWIWIGEGGVSEDDVTWVMTSSGPRKSDYFVYKYMKVYGGSRC